MALLVAAWHHGFGQTPSTISSFDLANNTGDSCSYNPNTPGIYAGVSGTVDNYYSGLSAIISWGDGSSETVTLMSEYFWSYHIYATPGTYTISCALTGGGAVLDEATISGNVLCTTIYSFGYLRNDANCTFDPGTDAYLNIAQQMQVSQDGTPIDTFMLGWGSYYTIENPNLTSEYTLTPIGSPSGYDLVCPAAFAVRLDTVTTETSMFAQYGYACNSATDFDLAAYMSGYLRFDNTSYLNILATNNTCTGQDGVLTLQLSPKYTFGSSNVTPQSVDGNTITWNLVGLSGSNASFISVAMTPATTLTPGDTATSTVSITPLTGDADVSNNTFVYTDTIKASYDPNDKTVSPAGYITGGEWLTYTINFENMGDDTAFNIHIMDTLSSLLQPATFELLSSSHPVSVNHFETGNGVHTLRFDFRDIQLASADDPTANKGFVMYKIKSADVLGEADAITNTAHIFFDINPAVTTNTVVSTTAPVSLQQINPEDGIAVYPNPASGKLFVENRLNQFHALTMINTAGQMILKQELKDQINTIDISGLSAGIYYMIVSGDKGTKSLKIVVH